MSRIAMLLHPVDVFRTAPVGVILGLANLWPAATSLYTLLAGNTDGMTNMIISYLSVALNGIMTIYGAMLANDQLKLRQRLERDVDTYGYQDRFFEPTTEEWCNRQTARFVCRRRGCLDKYMAYYEARKGSAKLSQLPNF